MSPLSPPQKNGLGKHCDERLAQKENSMKSKIAPGTSERLPRQILLFSLPLMASNVLQVLFNMADIAVIGRFAGSLSMAAVGSTATAVTLFTGILIGVGGGINALVARYYGARDRQELQRTVHSSAIICLICGILLLIFGFFGSRPLLRLLNTKPELLDKATLYMQIYFCGMPALALYNFGNAVYSAIGNTKKPLYYLLFSGIVNVVLNLVFVIVCDLDVAGVALASIISQYLSAIFLTAALFRSREAYGLSPKLLRLHRKNCREILTLGIPSGLQNAIFYIANMFIQAGVNSFDTVMVAGNSAAANADGLVYDVMAAFYTACSSFIGMNYGAGRRREIRRSYLICLGYSFGAGAILGFSLVAFGPTFLTLFTTDAAVISLGGVVISHSVRVGGTKMDEAILNFIKHEFNIVIGDRTAEEVKLDLGSALPLKDDRRARIRGRDMVTNLPQTTEITSAQIYEAIREPCLAILGAIKWVLERTPPELAADIMHNGIYLTGGSALLYGMDQMIASELGIPVLLAKEPADCAVLGLGYLIENFELLEHMDRVSMLKPF